MELVDIGVNLTSKRFRKDRDAVIERAVEAGVRRMILTGTSVQGSRQALELARTRPGVLWSTAGVHPHDASSCDDETLPALRALADEAVAIGECGLDFDRDFSPRPDQERWFEAQLALAAELSMPVFLHERAAHERFVAILGGWRDRLPAAVVHCFTGGERELSAYLDLDCHVGITGWICDDRRGAHLRDLVGQIPPDRLMVETDSPWLVPRDLVPKPKGGRNEPAFLPHIVHRIAGWSGRDAARVAEETTRAAEAFFGL